MSNSNQFSGIGFSGALLIVFIVLKLTGNIDWSWWWVLAPIWIPIVISIVILIIAMLIFFIKEIVKQRK